MILDLLKIETTLDLSLTIAILTAIIFYFGKLISEVQPTKENNYTNYVAGLFFVLLYLIFPVVLIIQFKEWLLFVPYNFVWILGIFIAQSFLFYILRLKVNMFKIQKNEFENKYKDEVIKHSKNITSKMNLRFDVSKTLNIVQKIFVKRLNNNALFVIIFLMTFIAVNIFVKSENLVLQFFFLIYYLLGVSNVAILYSWNQIKQYLLVKIVLENKKEINGKLIKIEEGYITLRTEDKIIHLNKDKVIAIEKIQNAPIINTTPLENIMDKIIPKSKNLENSLKNKEEVKK